MGDRWKSENWGRTSRGAGSQVGCPERRSGDGLEAEVVLHRGRIELGLVLKISEMWGSGVSRPGPLR